MLARIVQMALWQTSLAENTSEAATEVTVEVATEVVEDEDVLPEALPTADVIEAVETAMTLAVRPREDALRRQEISGCQNLLLEVIRRAAYDWVLYRNSRRMVQRVIAEQAYTWLFVEMPGTADWHKRERYGLQATSFLAICDNLDLDPQRIRQHIQRLTPQNIVGTRPAQARAQKESDDT